MFNVRREDLHNFTREENETLTRVGPATAMGNLFRQYWLPVVPSAHLSEPGGAPLRVKLLGEDLVLFRTHANQVGLIGAYCPHRLGAALFRPGRTGRPALSLSCLEIFAGGKVY